MKRLTAIQNLIDSPLNQFREHQEGLWTLLFGEYKLYTNYLNPLRDDTNPGCQFYYDSEGNLKFNDFAYKNYDLLDYTKEKFRYNLKEAIDYLNLHKDKVIKVEKTKTAEYTPEFIPKVKKSTNYFKLDKEWVKKWNIKELSGYFYNGKQFQYNPSYLYTYPDGGQKIYNPSQFKDKWKMIFPTNLVDGEWLLDNSKPYLVITSSRKDAITLNTLGIVNVVAPVNGENTTINLEYLINKYALKLAQIIIFPDNDKTGISFSNAYSKQAEDLGISHTVYNVPYMENYTFDDPYDVYKVSKRFAKTWVKPLLINLNVIKCLK